MVAQEWVGNELQSSIYFEPDEQGLDLFNAYLRSFRNEPIRLLVDLIEEEFRQIKIPLLRGSDRQAIIDRNYAKFFRNSEYRFAVSQSVEKGARKEEKLLLIGLTNQSLLEPWMRLINDTNTPLSGIISLPLLSEKFIDHFESEGSAKILVSQEVPSNLRQSVFIDGKLILSRLVPIASFYQGDYAGDVIRDIESTQRYLVSQRFVDRDGKVSVHIICNKRHSEKLTVKFAEEDYIDYFIHEINELLEEQKIKVKEEQDFSSALFCYYASKKLTLNHYAQSKHKKYYQHHKANLILQAASVAILTAGLGLAATSLVKGGIYASSVSEATQYEQKYSAKYNQLKDSFTDSTTSTTSMQNIVQTVENLEKNFLYDPEKTMSLVSRDISLFSDIRVTKLEWFLSNFSDLEKPEEVNWDNKKRVSSKKKNSKDGKKRKSVKGFFEVVNVEAEFLNFSGDYRYALSAVDDLEKTMVESGNYFEVEITRRPLDIEPENRLSGDVSAKKVKEKEKAILAFRLVRQVGRDE